MNLNQIEEIELIKEKWRNYMKKIPYGVSSFKQLIEKNMYYVDKTKYIEILENKEEYQFFIRPRRFGKSLFLSMIETYYDINEKDNFEKYFDGLYIQNNKTKLANKFIILKLDFSTVVTSEGKNRIINSFDRIVISAVDDCFYNYSEFLGPDKLPREYSDAIGVLEYLIKIAKRYNQKIMVLIDEYDNFANNIMSKDRDLFIELLNDTGYVRTFYKTLKLGTASSINRIFMTGVSPISLDEMTSGANMFSNITNREDLNAIVGFTKKEVNEIIDFYGVDKIVDRDNLLEVLLRYCNGYKFNKKASNTMYNTDMVLYIINNILDSGEYPDSLIDSNMKTDYTRLRELSSLFVDEDKMLSIIEREETKPIILKEKFNLESLTIQKEDRYHNMMSLLYYLGMLTIDRTEGTMIVLKIPNYSIRVQYWEYMSSVYNIYNVTGATEIGYAMNKMRMQGDCKDIFGIFTAYIRSLSIRDLTHFNELTTKAMFSILVQIDNGYVVQSEREANSGYSDMYLSENVNYPHLVKHNYLIEFKHIKKGDLVGDLLLDELHIVLSNNKSIINAKKTEAKNQLCSYIKETNIQNTAKKKIKKLIVITLGKQHVLYEEVE